LEVVEPFSNCRLNAEQRHQLFLAFKEALNNIIRHSGATEVQVTLSADRELKIAIADNGHGFEFPDGEGSHDGLIGMRERLQRLGGRCEIINANDRGTTVALTIPIEAQKQL
jgi:signal transduction histidine kinase